MIRVTVDEAKARLAELVESVLAGDDVYIEVGHEGDLDEQRAVRLVSAVEDQQIKGFGSMRGRLWIADNFDDPLEEFADYQ